MRALAMGLWVAFTLVACGGDEFPPNGYYGSCTSDEQCHEDYVCLVSASPANEGRQVCTVPCEEVDDCPVVFQEHCGGDTTTCDDGVCGFRPCR